MVEHSPKILASEKKAIIPDYHTALCKKISGIKLVRHSCLLRTVDSQTLTTLITCLTVRLKSCILAATSNAKTGNTSLSDMSVCRQYTNNSNNAQKEGLFY